jgi:anti-anti-sigma factor
MQTDTKVSQRSVPAASGNSVSILAASGDISSTSKDTLMNAWHSLKGGASNVLLDFSSVDYINSSGIAIIIQMLLEASQAGKFKVGIFGLSPHFTKVFTMVGINKYAALYGDEAAALVAI